MTKPDLLPCPFCGSEANVCHLISKNEPTEYGVSCVSCLANKRWYDTEAEAVEAWNTRTPTESAEVDLDDLKKAVRSYFNAFNGRYQSMLHNHGDDVIDYLASSGHLSTGKGVDEHPDDIAVDKFAASMKEKMAKKRAQGYRGWDDNKVCGPHMLSDCLRDHVNKGDPIDVGNFCMMLFNRGERIEQQNTAEPCGEYDYDVLESAARRIECVMLQPDLSSEMRAILGCAIDEITVARGNLSKLSGGE